MTRAYQLRGESVPKRGRGFKGVGKRNNYKNETHQLKIEGESSNNRQPQTYFFLKIKRNQFFFFFFREEREKTLHQEIVGDKFPDGDFHNMTLPCFMVCPGLFYSSSSSSSPFFS
jgi:hypothetical protein